MNQASNNDWQRLVAKTRRRALMNRPGVFAQHDGTLIRPQWTDRLVGIVVGLGLGIPCTWAAFQPEADLRWVLIVVGPLCLFAACSQVLWKSSLFIPTDSDDVIVRYGLVFLPVRLILPRQQLVVEYCLGAETGLSKSLRGFKFILLRDRESDEVAHVACALVSHDALRVFAALSELIGEGHNYTEAVIELDDGQMLKVDRLATWAAGKWRSYKSEISRTGSDSIHISRRAFGENRNVADAAADIYPVRIESKHSSVLIHYSNHDQRSVPDYECVAVQLCKEDIAQRRTRFEVNLITDSSTTERINLLSVDLQPGTTPDTVRDAASEIADLLELEFVDHL